jgi:hypothetical protein
MSEQDSELLRRAVDDRERYPNGEAQNVQPRAHGETPDLCWQFMPLVRSAHARGVRPERAQAETPMDK